MKARYVLLCVMALLACATEQDRSATTAPAVPPRVAGNRLTAADERQWLDTSDLVYTSDYFSFVGRDADGFVAFALDNNRGRDGTEYQAEHYTAMHDERSGWIDVSGTGRFENVGHELVGIPDSPFFSFTGEPTSGLRIQSSGNRLDVEIGPITDRIVDHDARTFYALGTAPAVLRWHGRAIEGRIIYEDFVKTGFNMMTRPDLSLLSGFNGFYLLTADGGDLYLHSTKGQGAGLPKPVLGFRVESGRSEILQDLHLEETGHEPAWGLYLWPTSWTATWRGPEGLATLKLAMITRRGMVNWVIGGYSLSIVVGEVSYAGKVTPVYGWGELIRG